LRNAILDESRLMSLHLKARVFRFDSPPVKTPLLYLQAEDSKMIFSSDSVIEEIGFRVRFHLDKVVQLDPRLTNKRYPRKIK
jgi:hypothetical protein